MAFTIFVLDLLLSLHIFGTYFPVTIVVQIRFFFQYFQNSWANTNGILPKLLGRRAFFSGKSGCTTEIIDFTGYRKILLNLVSTYWLLKVSRGIWTNRKRKNILNFFEQLFENISMKLLLFYRHAHRVQRLMKVQDCLTARHKCFLCQLLLWRVPW